jgi:murein DD-endopeptidase MepM/ murein hydrolase activator NlpD
MEQKSETEAKKKQMESTKTILDNRKSIAANVQNEKTEILTKTKSQEKNYQTLIQSIEDQRDAIEGEVARLEESLKAQIDPNLLPKQSGGVLMWPVEGKVTQNYGATSDAKYLYSKGVYKTATHNGIDIAASLGTPIYSSESGKVVAIGNQDKYCYRAAYGKFIVIQHDNYLTTFYAHLSLQTVKVGDVVKRGDLIGYIGNTGFSTGPHLHFTVYFSPTFKMTTSNSCGPMPIGAPVNPINYL